MSRTASSSRRVVFVIAAIVQALVLACVPRAANAVPMDQVPAFVIPRMSAPPTLDGSIDPVEWRESCAISGVVDQSNDLLLPRPTTFFMAWDADHLYFACRTYLRPGYKPSIVDGRSPGVAYCFDDGLELIFHPLGQNVGAGARDTAFKLFLSCLGYDGDLTRLAVGQQIKNWAPSFKTATHVTPAGSAPNGGSWWEMEVSTSITDFELTGPNKAGDAWRFMWGINHLANGWMQARIPCALGYFVTEGKNVGTLVENTPAVQFTMDSLNNLANDGTASLNVKVFNSASQEAKLTVDVNVADKIVKSEPLVVPAGGEAKFDLAEKLPADITAGNMSLRVSQDGKPLLTYFAPFKVGEYPKMLLPAEPLDPNKFAFESRFNPVRGWLLVKADAYYLPDPTAAKSLEYAVTSEGSSQPLTTGSITNVAEHYFQDIVKLDGLKPGKYTVQGWLNLSDGKKLGPVSATIEKKDEAAAFPDWWGKKFGNVERVLPPFTAITRDANTFGCWGRTYAINAMGLPDAVTSQGGAVLAAPARIVAVVNGKEEAIALGTPEIQEVTDWRVRFEGKASGAGLDFTAKGWLEQDGLVYVDITYRPQGAEPVRVDALRVEFPISDAIADGLVCVGAGGNFSSMTAKELPRDKQGPLWSTLETGRTGSAMRIGSFYPTVWIGNDQRGFLWCADHDRGWIPNNDIPAHDVTRAGNQVVLRNNIIGKPVDLRDSRTISLSYMASPFKPLPKGWRSMAATDDGTFAQPFRGVRTDSRTGEKYFDPSKGININWIHPESKYPEEWSPLWAEQKALADQHHATYKHTDPYQSRTGVNFAHMSFQLMGYGVKTMQQELYTYFGDEWYPGGQDTWNETYIDYAMYLFDRAFREGGVRSTYWDITFPMQFNSLLSGLCYRLDDGRVEPGYNSWNVRKFFMRMWALQHDYGLNPGAIGSHSTHDYVFVALPWLDAVLDGERGWDLDSSDRDWVDYYPRERMRAMCSPHNWGVGICWMSGFTSADPAKIERAKTIQSEYIWLHDSWKNPYAFPGPMRMPDAVLDWGINGEQTVYHPYWRNPYATVADSDVLVSMWQLPDRIMVEVFNYDRKTPKDITLKIDLAKLKLMPELPWQEFVGVRDLYKLETDPAAVLDVAGGTLTVRSLQPHRGRLIGVRRY